MKSVATILVVVLSIVIASGASGPAAAETIVVRDIFGFGGIEIKVTNLRTGATRTVRSDQSSNAEFRGLEPGVYKIEEAGAQTRYIELKPGAVGTRVQMEGMKPANVQQLVQSLDPAARESAARRLDAPGTAADKARAIGEQVQNTEEQLKRAIEVNERTPGLIDIGAVLATLNALEAIRAHYANEDRQEKERGLRRSAGDQPNGREIGRSGFRFDLFAGAESVELQRVNLGTVLVGGREQALHRSDDRVSGAGFEARVGYRIGDVGWLKNARAVFSAGYLGAQDSDAVQEPIGGRNVANTYHLRAPNNSTGVLLGATGLEVSQQVDVSAYRAVLGLAGRIPLTESKRFGLSPFVGLKYERFEQEYRGDLRSLAFSGIRATTEQEIIDHYYGPSFGAYLDWKCEDTMFMVGGKIDLFYRHSRLDSVQRNRCDLCPPAEQAFDAAFSDRDSGFTYGGEFRVGVSHRLLPGLRLGANAGVRYRDERSSVFNPGTPSDGTIRFVQDSAFDGFVTGRASLQF